VAVRASTSKQVDSLIRDLASGDDVARDAAIARFAVIGERAVERLLAVVSSAADPPTRVAALRALEGIGDERGLAAALDALADVDAGVAVASIALVRQFLRGARGAAVVDRLTALVLDDQAAEAVRSAALVALRDLEPKTIAPLLERLANDRNAAIRVAVRSLPAAPAGERLRQSNGSLSDVRDWLAREGPRAPLSTLAGLIEQAREREGASRSGKLDWAEVRFVAHVILARRDSRVALYDLREAFEAATAPLPATALDAVARIGDSSCLEAIASAYTRSKNPQWRRQLLETFHAVATREKITGRHAVMKRIARRYGWAGGAGGPGRASGAGRVGRARRVGGDGKRE